MLPPSSSELDRCRSHGWSKLQRIRHELPQGNGRLLSPIESHPRPHGVGSALRARFQRLPVLLADHEETLQARPV